MPGLSDDFDRDLIDTRGRREVVAQYLDADLIDPSRRRVIAPQYLDRYLVNASGGAWITITKKKDDRVQVTLSARPSRNLCPFLRSASA
jgi:hypothetical protein